MRAFTLRIAGCAVLASAAGCGNLDLVGETAPEFVVLHWANVDRASRPRLEGSLVLAAFFSPQNGASCSDVPRLVALRRRYGSRGLVVVGIAQHVDLACERFARDYGADYPMICGDRDIYGAFGVGWVPEYVLIDEAGVVVAQGLSDVEAELVERFD